MSSVFGFAWSIINFVLAVGVAGGLVDLVVDMSHNAWHADHIGIISMRSLTHQLMSPDRTIQELKEIRRARRGKLAI